MKLIIQPDAGLEPVVLAMRGATHTIDLTIVRMNRPEVEKRLCVHDTRLRSWVASACAWLLAAAVASSAGATAAAQTPPPCMPPDSGVAAGDAGVCEDTGIAERSIARYRAMRERGISPKVGSIVPGASLSVGVELRRDRFYVIPVGGSVEGTWSVRGYQDYVVRLGAIRGNTHQTRMRPLGWDMTSAFNEKLLLARGLSVYVELGRRVYPRLDFFGLGSTAEEAGRRDFGLTSSSIDAVMQWQGDRHFGVTARAGWMNARLTNGTNDTVADLHEIYTPATLHGMANTDYRSVGLAATLDYRDKPTRPSSGSWLSVGWWTASAEEQTATAATQRFHRLIVDARHYLPLGAPTQVLVMHGVISTRVAGDQATPFYLQPTLGGSRTLRAFRNYRWRGDAAWAATAEWRWHVWKWVELAPFVDVGAVAADSSALRTSSLLTSPGIGVRGRTGESVLGRLDYAVGRDGHRVVFTLSSGF